MNKALMPMFSLSILFVRRRLIKFPGADLSCLANVSVAHKHISPISDLLEISSYQSELTKYPFPSTYISDSNNNSAGWTRFL